MDVRADTIRRWRLRATNGIGWERRYWRSGGWSGCASRLLLTIGTGVVTGLSTAVGVASGLLACEACARGGFERGRAPAFLGVSP